eukprot:TRINITY_DN5079_c0_g1_i1.p1 TRINITY_DN5079_c0_g1~~TRINITY_DN5079_c0_g1_i1.p1  ORF type:complete len:133 (-),score=4.48 TRINITY_DN5079_c0_g1_i1:155-553(-)
MCPSLTDEIIRKFSFGDYSIVLSERYVRHFHTSLEQNDKIFRFLQNSRKLLGCAVLVQVRGMKSRFRSGVGRIVFVLFKKGQIEDTLCNWVSGKRATSSCAHGIAVLGLIKKEQEGTIGEFYSMKSGTAYDS